MNRTLKKAVCVAAACLLTGIAAGEKPVERKITLLFNRTGKVGGEMRLEEKDAEGRVRSTVRPLAETVTPQKGVLLCHKEITARGIER